MNLTRLIPSIIRKVKKNVITPRQIRSLATSSDAQVAGVGNALLDLIDRRLEPAAQQWISKIESVRQETNNSTQVVEVPDYGAGGPEDTRSDDEMKKGKICTEIVGEACRNYSKEPLWAELLFHIIRQLKPTSCIEMGACLGISAGYQAAALELNGAGRLVTMEGAASFAQIAEQNLKRLGLGHRAKVVVGRFHDTLDGVLAETKPVDCCFIDGHHDEVATVEYFERVLPHLSPRAVLLFDDIRWSSGMLRAWTKISSDSRVQASFDLGKVGICLLGASESIRCKLVIE
jgi:predicted O-methyltransferase YrrM